MVKRRALPRSGSMTLGAIRAKLSVMFIVLLMAGIAVLRRTFEYAIDMTTYTSHANVRAGQLECRVVMVESRRFPRAG